ncbi:MAG: hypothetical protein ABIJ92_03690 [Candidatus Aenigmatarchaeota archaeon]
MRLKLAISLVVAVILFLSVTSIYAPQSSEPVIQQYCTEFFSCLENGTGITCQCDPINKSDNIYVNGSIGSYLVTTSGTGSAIINASFNQSSIPDGSNITNVTLFMEWASSHDTSVTCSIELYTGTWEIVNTTCLTTEDNYSYNLNSFIDTEIKAESLMIRVNVTSLSGTRWLILDNIYVNVTYLPPHRTNNYNLTYSNGSIVPDGLVVYRNETFNASAYWETDNVYNALVEHNGTGSFVNYSFNESAGFYPLTGNWSNYTLNLSNGTLFSTPGIIVFRMHTEDEYGQWNSTQVDHYLALWGENQLTNLTFDSTTLINGSSSVVYCNVSDVNTSAAIGGYNVSFYQNDVLWNYSLTNASGISNVTYVDSSTAAQNITFKCNITSDSSLFYFSSSVYEQSSNVSIVTINTINMTVNYSIYNRGENVTFVLLDNYNNTISNVSWNITWINYTETVEIIYDQTNETYYHTISDTENVGNHTVLVNVTKNGEYFQSNWTFNISSTLIANFSYPPENTTYVIDTPIADPQVQVFNIRNESLGYSITSVFDCPGVGTVALSTQDYVIYNSTTDCDAPSAAGAFNLIARMGVIGDSRNNLNVTLSLIAVNPGQSVRYSNITYASNGTNITDGDQFYRSDILNITTFWNTSNVTLAYVEHNGTGSFVNYTVNDTNASGYYPTLGNWSNGTLNLSDFTRFLKAGNIVVRMHAHDVYDQTNSTVDHNFSFWGDANVSDFDYDGSSIINGSSINFYCNVSDVNTSSILENYNVTFYQNGVQFNYSLTNSSGIATGLYTDSSTVNQNITFKCNITDHAPVFYNNSAGSEAGSNVSVVTLSTINLTNNMTVSNATVYNRGENMTIAVLDSDNNTVNSLSWNVTIVKFNETANITFSQTNDTYTYTLNTTEPVGNYSIFVNVSKGGNYLETNWTFNVSNELSATFYKPLEGSSIATSGIITDPVVVILNARSENLSYIVNVSVECPNTGGSLANTTANATNTTYENAGLTCTAPSSAGAFQIIANTSDTSGNLGNGTVGLTATASVTVVTGGGAGGGSAQPLNCTCDEWVSQECGAGGCDVNSIFQTRTCSPSACSNETRCVASPSCIGVRDFEFNVSTEEITVVQGNSDTVVGSVINTGDFLLDMNVTIQADCCEINPIEGFTLEPKETKNFPVNIHVPLSQTPGTYVATVQAITRTLTKENSVKIIVQQHPLIPKIKQMESKLVELERLIADSRDAGVPVAELEELAGNIETAIGSAKEGIQQDNLDKLESQINFAESNVGLIETRLAQLGIVKILAENKFGIGGAFLFGLFFAYLFSQVVIPYMRLGRSIGKLLGEEKELVGTRQATEKQYFTRRIDEKTFNTIMISGQGKILKARSQLKIMKEERSSLIKARLTPKALFNWLKSGPKKLGGKFRRNKRQEFMFQR